ncbi:MAG: hypothetical protein ABSC37_12590 [Xanthobacteraceae bacterium]
MLRKLMQAAAVIALLTGTASAQMPMPAVHLNGDKRPPTPEEIEKQKAIDNAYKSATQKIPDKKPVDPWGNVRPNPSPASKNKQ